MPMMDDPDEYDFPEYSGGEAIELMQPNSDHHKAVLTYMLKRIKQSEEEMNKFYNRWQVNERKLQAYISLNQYERQLKDMNDQSKTPAPSVILFPYMYAVVATTVAYCMKVFCGRKPFFPLSASSSEASSNVRFMESMVQHQLDQSQSIMRIFQACLDGQVYGVSVVRCLWRQRKGKRRILRAPTEAERLMYANNPEALPGQIKDSEEKVIFAGSELANIDPFMFFPDPTVPMCEVSRKGEFVFAREYMGKHKLLRAEQNGELKYVRNTPPQQGDLHDSRWFNLSQRNILTSGQAHAGDSVRNAKLGQHNTYQVDQGTIELIPSELGIGPGEYPEKWLVTILNKQQIVQLEPLDYDHDRHPFEVSEPTTFGYGFGQPAMSDFVGPIQDLLSWFLSSHVYNVRTHLNNILVYDPSKINEKDLKFPQPGGRIRLKPAAYGQDARQAIQQLNVSDVTRNHMQDLGAFIRIGDMVSSVNDPMRGVSPQGGRRTATETRFVGESAFGRLGVMAQLISQQQFTALTEQMVLNIQQFQDLPQFIQVLGEKQVAAKAQEVGPKLLTGDFTYQVNDGTLPLDKVAGFDLWKEILINMAKDPELRRTHSLPRIFEHVCSLGGAPNITQFRMVEDAALDSMGQAGNVLPLNEAAAAAPNGGFPQ